MHVFESEMIAGVLVMELCWGRLVEVLFLQDSFRSLTPDLLGMAELEEESNLTQQQKHSQFQQNFL